MFKKVCFSPEVNSVSTHSNAEISANPKLVERMTKLANGIKTIAPKSDDFLYFSIIFLKAAESATLDDAGLTKKTASGEDAWGFFDENWKWHGNVSPHRNNNKDIFPESELKIAAKKWIGMPLCRDHESSSVDGIRGIILDAHYDEKFKQVVGLCALDKVNYPDLARKVETGLVRYGSMGTAVETSICSECGNRAKTQKDYCEHINNKIAHGEINVGLKPIEYSLVVQPAEPGAVLLKCIASLQDYRKEFTNYGVDNVDEMLGRLSVAQAQHLEGIMKTACGSDGCSISERQRIVRSFLANNSLLTKASYEEVDPHLDFNDISNALRSVSQATEVMNDPTTRPEVREAMLGLIEDIERLKPKSRGQGATETLTSEENFEGTVGPGGVAQQSTANANRVSMLGGGETEPMVGFSSEDDVLSHNNQSGANAVTIAENKVDHSVKVASNNNDVDYVDDFSINSIMEEIMNESRLRKRAELRRRVAYMQGGSEGREPNTFKSETFDRGQDKHMHQTGNMGGADSMVPGDKEVKEKVSRAAYNGPALSTRFSVKRRSDGSEDRGNSLFEVFAGNKRVIAATASDIYGEELAGNWEWITSKEYGREVCSQIREVGLNKVSSLLKTAQELPPPPDMGDMGGEMPPAPDMGGEMPPAPDMGGEMPPAPDMGAPMDAEAPAEEELSPAEEIENRLAEMEQLLDEIRDHVSKLEDERLADVDVNVFTGKGKEGESVDAGPGGLSALSSHLLDNLKVAYRKLDSSADELALVAETYDNISKLSSENRGQFRRLASAAVRDADQITGETRSLVKMAVDLTISEVSDQEDHAMSPDDIELNYAYDNDMRGMEDHGADMEDHGADMEDHGADMEDHGADMEDLVAEAMAFRRSRREAILKQAQDRHLSDRAERREALLKQASTGDSSDEVAEDALEDAPIVAAANEKTENVVKDILEAKLVEKRADEERENYRIKLRRAYDVGLEMQRKGLLAHSKTALDKQVDEIMTFDNNAFEAFKRSIANARKINTVKVATDLGGVNIGVESEQAGKSTSQGRMSAEALSSMWE